MTDLSSDTKSPLFSAPRRSRLRAEVEQELHRLFSRQTATAQAYGTEFSRLWSMAARHVQGGKLVRPVLLLETFDALQRARAANDPGAEASVDHEADRAEVVRVAAAVEALHFTFLLHDDVIDGDLLRRGRPNLIGELAAQTTNPPKHPSPSQGAEHWAQAGGILMGDLLLAAAHQLFARLEVSGNARLRLLDLLEHTVIETTAGEFTDVGLSDGLITSDLNTVLAMTGRKTASYSFELPLRAAVILAGGASSLEDTLSSAGSHLGLAYQLQDDLLSTFGDASIHGKDPYSDLREGKQTAIICFARMTSTWPSIESEFGNPELSQPAAEQLRERLRECGAEGFVQGLIDEQLTAFYEVLAGGSQSQAIPGEVRAVLLELAARLEGREA